MMSLALSAPESVHPAAVGGPIGRTLSEAPTVITFFAVPGAPIVLAPAPELPAEKTW